MRALPVLLLMLAAPLAGIAQQHHHHEAPAGREAGGEQGAIFTAADLRFLQHMIVHHQQALDMAALVPGRSGRASFLRFTDYIARAQAAEIRQMEALLDLAEARGISLPEHELHGDPPMPGMLSSAEMAALEEASGAGFERLWIEGMIHHHQGAVDMALAQQRQQLAEGRRPYGLGVMVEQILEEQRAEITRMRDWLEEWGLRDG